MAALLDGPVSSVALCWRIERPDGAGLALTSHDKPLVIGGIIYEASPGMVPAAVQRKAGLEPGGGEIAGAINSASIEEQDLVLGRWDGARVTLCAVDWLDPDGGQLKLTSGELGEVRVSGEAFTTELRGAAAKLDRAICPETSPECRAELGDKRCRVDLAGRTMRCRIIGLDGNAVLLDQQLTEDFRWGRARFTSGENCGITGLIVSVDGNRIELRELPKAEIAIGDGIELRHGCDKRFATCTGRYANGANFRGEPHLPGNDLLTRFPGA